MSSTATTSLVKSMVLQRYFDNIMYTIPVSKVSRDYLWRIHGSHPHMAPEKVFLYPGEDDLSALFHFLGDVFPAQRRG